METTEYFGSQSVFVEPVPDDDSLFSSLYFGAVYSKGAWVLHMLRRTVGDDVFFDILSRHRDDGVARGGFANTGQFIEISEDLSGMDLERFFRQWLYLTGVPTFEIEPFVSASGNTLWLRLAQDAAQDTCFAADLEVTVFLASGKDTVLVAPVRAWTDTVVLVCGGLIESIAFDEENWLLDDGFQGPVDYALAIDDDETVTLRWDVVDDFVTGVWLYSAPTAKGPWSLATPALSPLPKSGEWEAGRPSETTYYVIRAVSDSLPGYESTPSNVVLTKTPGSTATLTDSTATNPYVLGGDPYAVKFNLARPGNVSIRVYDISGRLVRELRNAYMPAGFGHRVQWNGDNGDGRRVAPGIYLIRFEADGLQTTRKVVVLN
ncbi:MAG: FlgD immunoglobulin-like domain containing protein [Candidatus Eisenbacteria bacterium]